VVSNPEKERTTAGRLMDAARRGVSAAWRRHGIEKLGPLEEIDIQLPHSGMNLHITKPSDIDALLTLAENDPEENLPYWAALWPSGIALADEILADPELVREGRVLELGSGLGVTAMAALSVDADLTISDYADESLQLAVYNIVENGFAEPPAVQMNWRDPSMSFRKLVGDGFPVVLAADVLYEQRDIEPLLELVDWLVAPGGLLWLAEPRRYSAGRFVELAQERGWIDAVSEYGGPWPEMDDTGVRVRVHRLRRAVNE
jgi:predicted nicotinamide N-methyase